MSKVEFKRVETDEEIDNIDIKDGQLIYSKSGKTFMDYGEERIPTGSGGGSEIVISEEQPTTDDWKLWIDSDEVENTGSEVVNTLAGNETNKAPSVHTINDLITYSAQERQIGWWEKEDGTKVPLYRKYITGNDTRTDQNINIPHNIENVDILMVSGKSRLKIGENTYPIIRASITTADMDKKTISYNTNNTNIVLYVGSYLQISGYSYCFILEYTKTTD